MTPRQLAIVKQTWQQLAPRAEGVAELFYARLFELDPTLRRLFRNDMRAQGRMLTSVITLAVSQLERVDKLVPVLRDLGARHVNYGVKERDYSTVGAALLDTLAAGLKEDFTPEVEEAWAATYVLLAETMKSGAAQALAAAA